MGAVEFSRGGGGRLTAELPGCLDAIVGNQTGGVVAVSTTVKTPSLRPTDRGSADLVTCA